MPMMTARPGPMSERQTVIQGNMLYTLAMLTMEKGLINGLVEFDGNVIHKIVLKDDPISFKSYNL